MANADASPGKPWRTAVSEVTPESVCVRGYPLEELIGRSFTATTFLLIAGRLPTPAEVKVLDAVLTGVLDYGLEKSGTAAARYVVSCNPNMQAGLATAILGAGEFGLGTEHAARFIATTYDRFVSGGHTDMAAFATEVVRTAKERKERIPGFGPPVFRHVDPRAAILRRVAVEAGLWGPAAQLYEEVHRVFITQPGREHFPINDVAMMAAITVAMGFTPQESTALAIIGTLPGVVAHISEEFASGHVGRGIPASSADYDVAPRDLEADARAAGWAPGRFGESG